jgi:hypothetical protein
MPDIGYRLLKIGEKRRNALFLYDKGWGNEERFAQFIELLYLCSEFAKLC